MMRFHRYLSSVIFRCSLLLFTVSITASCQSQDPIVAGGPNSESLLSIPDSINSARSLSGALLTSSLFVNNSYVNSRVSASNGGYSISAEIDRDLLIEGVSSNSLILNIFYPCGRDDAPLAIISLEKIFDYSGDDIVVTATRNNDPDSDLDGISNYEECDSGTLPYDSNSPAPPVVVPSTGSVLFSVGIADNRFYDSDTNDSLFLGLDGAVQSLNDTFVQAQYIGGSAETTGYVSRRDDEDDYYYIGGSGVGSVTLLFANESADLDLVVYNYNRERVGQSVAAYGNESLSNISLPAYVRVNGYNIGQTTNGSVYKLITAFSSQSSVPSTVVARFRLNLVDTSSGATLWEAGRYDATFVVNAGLGNKQVLLSGVPTGEYNFVIHSNTDKDNGQFDSFFDMGVSRRGNLTVRGGEETTQTVVLD